MATIKNKKSDEKKQTNQDHFDESKIPMFIAIIDGFSICHNVSFDDMIFNEELSDEFDMEIDILKSYYPEYKKVVVESIPAFIKQIYPDIRRRLESSIEVSKGVAVVP